MSRRERAFCGADLGGSWLRVALVDERGRLLRRGKVAAVPPMELPAALERLFRSWKTRPAAIVAGSTRLGRPADRARLAAALRRVAPKAAVWTDLELAWQAAFGGAPGVMILSGTGSLAYGRDARGRAARVGGLGPLLGDEGSAFWIGRQWLRAGTEREALRYAHRGDVIPAVARLADRVLRAAAGKSASGRTARRILAEAQAALAAQARAAAGLLDFRGRVPVSWHGGMMERPAFRAGVLARLGPRFAPQAPLEAPELAAARLAGRRPRRAGPRRGYKKAGLALSRR